MRSPQFSDDVCTSAAVHESGCGTKLPFEDVRHLVATEGKSDMVGRPGSVEIDPKRDLQGQSDMKIVASHVL